METLRAFLAAHSKVFQELTEDATVDELLTGYECDRTLLERLPALYTDNLKLSNCLLDATYLYDSLIGCNKYELVALARHVDYLYLPSRLTRKLKKVIIGGIDCDKYMIERRVGKKIVMHCKFDKTNTAHWVELCDYKGMDWAIKQGYPWNKLTAHVAAKSGDLNVLHILYNAGCPMKSDVFTQSALSGKLDNLEWLKSIGCPLPKTAEACSAAARTSLECLEWLHKIGCPWNSYTYSAAAKKGKIDCLRYMDQHKCPTRSYACFVAAKNGHLNTLKYLYKHNRCWGHKWKDACSGAAAGGKLEILKFLHEHHYPWDEETCRHAALYGHLDCLEYAHTHGCPWDESVCASAAFAGHLECLQYAHTHGCPWDHTTIEKAKRENNQACLNYAITNGCPASGGCRRP